MQKLRTDKDELSPKDILEYIETYEKETVPKLDMLWDYYLGKNTKILSKRSIPDNPDNKTPVSYGRKIITTFTGYAYRPRYITYKSENEAYLGELEATFDENNEHIKTSLNGRNTGIFGVSYEMLYIGENRLGQPETKFAVIDPRELILLNDFSIEPVKNFAIRFYMVNPELYKVVVYDDNKLTMYDMIRDRNKYSSKLVLTGTEAHYFGELPIIAYYLGDEIQGIIEPVIPLIDDYDVLVSDSMVEFDRYANSYLKLVKMSIGAEDQRNLKRKRIFEQLPDKDAVSFLTKDIPTAYIEFMTKLIRDQIHIQSHVPDLGSGSFADGISGVAVDRLMFDFENVVSNAEAEFDTGLYDRIRLITNMYGIMGRTAGTFDEIMISHKRNKPNNGLEFSQIALNLKNTGISQYAIVDYMPDDIIPDTDAELEREKEEQDAAMADIEDIPNPDDNPEEVDNGDR